MTIPLLSPNGQTSTHLDAPPLELLAGTVKGVYRISRKTPRSEWTSELTLPGRHIASLVQDSKGDIYAACHKDPSVFRSCDGGGRWEEMGKVPGATHVYSLAVVNNGTREVLFAGIEPAGVQRSFDQGRSWEAMPAIARVPGADEWSFPPPPHVPHVKSMTSDPSRPDTFFACVEQGALLRTEDGGRTWTDLKSVWRAGDLQDAHHLLIAPWDPRQYYLSTGQGVYGSADAGATWERFDDVDGQVNYPDGLVAAAKERVLYVSGPKDIPGMWLSGDAQGLVTRSDDGARTWKTVYAGKGIATRSNIEAMSIVNHPQGHVVLTGDTDGNIVVSEDGGQRWERIAVVGSLSKSDHYAIAHLGKRLPHPVAWLMTKVVWNLVLFSIKVAKKKRKKAYASMAH